MRNRPYLLLSLVLCLLVSACTGGNPSAAQTLPVSSGADLPGLTRTPLDRDATPIPGSPGKTPTGTQLSGPALNTPLPGSLPFEVIGAGAPLLGDPQPLNLALSNRQPDPLIPGGLPQAARQALEDALEQSAPRLILLLYAGEVPSGGFSLQIESITLKSEQGKEILHVRYYLQPPDPQTGAITALTFPYLILSLEVDLAPEQVRFEQVIRQQS